MRRAGAGRRHQACQVQAAEIILGIRIGLLGAGRIAQTLSRVLIEDVKGATLSAIADVDFSRARALAEPIGVESIFSDLGAMAAGAALDGVVIATPTSTHAALIRQAAQAGLQIFSEKPLALTLADCDLAIAATDDAGVLLQIGFMRRFDPVYRAAKAFIDSGAIGTPVMFKAVSRDPQRTSLEFAQRERSGGLIFDMSIHDFDLARWLMGSEVVRVHAEGDCLVYPELKQVNDIDNAVINLKFDGGAIGDIDASRNAVYGQDVRTEILGSEGSLNIGQRGSRAVVFRRTAAGEDQVFELPLPQSRFRQAFAEELRSFVHAIETAGPSAVPGVEGRKATAIALAATRSLDEGRAVALADLS